MARISKEQLLEKINDVGEFWMIDVRESERGWGSSTEQEIYTSYEEAHERYTSINKDNPTDRVPDYYIVASEPKKVKITIS